MSIKRHKLYYRMADLLRERLGDEAWANLEELERRKGMEIEYPVRCEIIDVTGVEVFPGFSGRTPDASKPHIGKHGIAEETADGNIKITLDDGSVIFGYECWWVPEEGTGK